MIALWGLLSLEMYVPLYHADLITGAVLTTHYHMLPQGRIPPLGQRVPMDPPAAWLPAGQQPRHVHQAAQPAVTAAAGHSPVHSHRPPYV
jgi:hypothetical protein